MRKRAYEEELRRKQEIDRYLISRWTELKIMIEAADIPEKDRSELLEKLGSKPEVTQ